MIQLLIEKITHFSENLDEQAKDLASKAELDKQFIAGQQDALSRVLGEINAMEAAAQQEMAGEIQAAMNEAKQPTKEAPSGRKNHKSAGRKKTAGTK